MRRGGRQILWPHPAKQPAFTLIEMLSVIAIIGILVAVGAYLFVEAEAQGRDTARKSDLNQVAEAFGARQLDLTCSDQSTVGVYPGESLETNGNPWVKVSELANYSDGCGSFTSFLPTIPADPLSPARSYYFNLSTYEVVNGTQVAALAKHFRLTAELEHQLSTTEQTACVAQSQIWRTEFGGQYYDCERQVIGDANPGLLLVAADNGSGQICQVGETDCSQGSAGSGSGGSGSGGSGSGGNGSLGSGSGSNGGSQPGPYNYYVGF